LRHQDAVLARTVFVRLDRRFGERRVGHPRRTASVRLEARLDDLFVANQAYQRRMALARLVVPVRRMASVR
jgi:hypothetical protein